MTSPESVPHYGITYAQALEQMRALVSEEIDCTGDNHIAADGILCSWLRQQGYDELVSLFNEVGPKWYT